jgi:RNA-directed DNA polymerase
VGYGSLEYTYEYGFGHYSRANRGELGEALSDHRAEVAAWRSDPSEAPNLMSGLLEVASNPQMLMLAWEELSGRGEKAPGPDGLRYSDFQSSSQIWSALRDISADLRDGEFRRGPLRKVKVPKFGKDGHRVIHIPNIATNVVSRSVLETVQPIIDPDFHPLSVGFRPKRDRCHGLAAAEHLVRECGLTCWLTFDLKQAFDRIPRQRLMQIVRQRLDGSPICGLIKQLVSRSGKLGIPQGFPTSPMLMNLYVDHFFDRKWAKLTDCPLIRYADDFLLLCRSPEQAQELFAEASDLIRVSGFRIKESFSEAFHNLADGDAAEWLGFRITPGGDGGLEFGLTDKSWWRLQESFGKCGAKEAPQKRASAVGYGWISANAIAIEEEQLSTVIRRIEETASTYGFDEIQIRGVADKAWQGGLDVWRRFREEAVSWVAESESDCESSQWRGKREQEFATTTGRSVIAPVA